LLDILLYYFVFSHDLQGDFLNNESGDGGYVVCYEMADIERKLGFGRDSLVNF